MEDAACVAFLQWALPRLGLRWAGFRRVRRQVAKRIEHRLSALALADIAAYRDRLEIDDGEWRVLDGLCRIPISRFLRDHEVFACLGEAVLPELARAAAARGDRRLGCWSAGCASGEEPYSLSLVWSLTASPRSPAVGFEVVATDADANMLARARSARYKASSLKELPVAWRKQAFASSGSLFDLHPGHRACVTFMGQDIRIEAPPGRFDLVLCRNLAFTYFAANVQRDVLRRVADALTPNGVLVIGSHERLPEGAAKIVAPWSENLGIYRRNRG